MVEHPDVAERYQQKISKVKGIVPFSVKDSELNVQTRGFSTCNKHGQLSNESIPTKV
jgi:hypothetical protein